MGRIGIAGIGHTGFIWNGFLEHLKKKDNSLTDWIRHPCPIRRNLTLTPDYAPPPNHLVHMVVLSKIRNSSGRIL